jgi:hypothetical protein
MGAWGHIFICYYFLGCTAVPGAVKRRLEKVVHKIIADI